VPKDNIKVLIADDSAVVREILKDMMEDESDLEVVGEAKNGKEAVELAGKIKPDIITMDVIMPVMNGLEAVEEIMAFSPTPILVFSSVLDDKEMDVAFHAIARGALDVMEKPKVADGDQFERIRLDLLNKLRMLSRIHVIPHLKGKKRRPRKKEDIEKAKEAPVREPPPPPVTGGPVLDVSEYVKLPPERLVKRKLVAVGASTGGPKALVQIFRRIPEGFPLPILTVQHIAPSFAPGLVSWLDRSSQLRVVLAEEKIEPAPGTVYVASTGSHMVYSNGKIMFTDSDPVNSCRPSVDVLFDSVAEFAGDTSVGVLLTGMGRDGARGLKAIRDKRGRTMIQDEATSVIFGMPRAAMEMGAAEEILPLGEIPEAIMKAITR